MVSTIIIAIALIVIMLSFSFFIFKNLIKRINDSAKRYFIEKLQEYNYLIDEKEETLKSLNNEIDEKKKKLSQIKLIEEDKEGTIFSTDIQKRLEAMKKYKAKFEKQKTKEIIYDIPTPKYREESFFDTYKNLKKKFDIDNEKTIKEFLKSHPEKENNSIYEKLNEFRQQFTDKIIYECLTLEKQEQYSIIKDVLDEEISELIEFKNKFKNPNKFIITEFIELLEEKIKNYNPNIYVYVGKDSVTYDNIDKRIKTKFYKNMSEGVIIFYKGKIYDYSI